MSIERCRIIDLTQVQEPRGNLTFVASDERVPFTIERVYHHVHALDAVFGALRSIGGAP